MSNARAPEVYPLSPAHTMGRQGNRSPTLLHIHIHGQETEALRAHWKRDGTSIALRAEDVRDTDRALQHARDLHEEPQWEPTERFLFARLP